MQGSGWSRKSLAGTFLAVDHEAACLLDLVDEQVGVDAAHQAIVV